MVFWQHGDKNIVAIPNQKARKWFFAKHEIENMQQKPTHKWQNYILANFMPKIYSKHQPRLKKMISGYHKSEKL